MAINTAITGSYFWNGKSYTNCFVYKGIKYSDCLYKDCFYIKYKLPEDITIDNLIKGIEYYIYELSFDGDNNKVYMALTLSHKEDYITNEEKQTYYSVNLDDFFNGLCLSGAIIKYHINGGQIVDYSVTAGYSSVTTEITDTNTPPLPLSNLFYKEYYTGKWLIKNYNVFVLNDIGYWYTSELQEDSLECVLNWDAFPAVFPETSIVLQASWDLDTIEVTYHYENGSIVTQKNQIYQAENGKYYINLREVSGSGWHTSNDTSTLRYDGLIYFSTLTPFSLWQSRDSYSDVILDCEYYSDRGFRLENTITKKFTIPGDKEDFNGFNEYYSYYPMRVGSQFTGWKARLSDEILLPGDTITGDYYVTTYLHAMWQPVSDILSGSFQITKDHIKYNGYKNIKKIEASSTATKYSLYIKGAGVGNLLQRTIMVRAIDSVGQEIDGSYLKFTRKNTLQSSTINFIVPANETCYLEIVAEKINTDPYQIVITTSSINWPNKELTIDCNGGTSETLNEFNITSQKKMFSTQPQTTSLISTTNFDTKTADTMRLPNKSDYYFTEWSTQEKDVSINKIIQSSYEYYEASSLPTENFVISANWEPNVFFIKYDGNDNDATTAMSSSSHKCDQDIHVLNQYARSTTLTFIPRKGKYIANQEWVNVSNVEPIINADNKNRKAKVHHTFNKWLNDKFEIESPDTIIDFDVFKDLNDVTSFNYGDTIDLTAQWRFNSIPLPHMERDGFIFMGWYDAPEGGNKIGDGGDEVIYEDHDITLYAHWDPIGLVMINTPQGWKKAVPYIYTDGTWKRALTNIYTNSDWQLGTNLGQNATDEQLEFL